MPALSVGMRDQALSAIIQRADNREEVIVPLADRLSSRRTDCTAAGLAFNLSLQNYPSNFRPRECRNIARMVSGVWSKALKKKDLRTLLQIMRDPELPPVSDTDARRLFGDFAKATVGEIVSNQAMGVDMYTQCLLFFLGKVDLNRAYLDREPKLTAALSEHARTALGLGSLQLVKGLVTHKGIGIKAAALHAVARSIFAAAVQDPLRVSDVHFIEEVVAYILDKRDAADAWGVLFRAAIETNSGVAIRAIYARKRDAVARWFASGSAAVDTFTALATASTPDDVNDFFPIVFDAQLILLDATISKKTIDAAYVMAIEGGNPAVAQRMLDAGAKNVTIPVDLLAAQPPRMLEWLIDRGVELPVGKIFSNAARTKDVATVRVLHTRAALPRDQYVRHQYVENAAANHAYDIVEYAYRNDILPGMDGVMQVIKRQLDRGIFDETEREKAQKLYELWSFGGDPLVHISETFRSDNLTAFRRIYEHAPPGLLDPATLGIDAVEKHAIDIAEYIYGALGDKGGSESLRSLVGRLAYSIRTNSLPQHKMEKAKALYQTWS